MSTSTLLDRAASITADMKSIVETADSQGRALTTDESESIITKAAERDSLIDQHKKSQAASKLVSDLAGGGTADAYSDSPDQWHGKSAGPLGRRVAKADAFAGFRKTHPSGVSSGTPIDLKAHGVGTLDDLGIGAKAELTTATGQPTPTRLPGYRNELLDYPFSILDLIATGTTTSQSLEYARIVAETNNAAIVPEGALKPLSDLTTAIADAKAHTFADGFVVTNQFLSDEPALAAFMQSRLPIHLRAVTEDKILNGAGGSGDVEGLLNTTGVQSVAFDEDMFVSIARGIEKLETVNVSPQAIVVHPSDVWKMRLAKNAKGDYIAGGPFTMAPFAPWEVPVVKSFRMQRGTYAMGNWQNINLLEREALSVLAFNQHKDFAQTNRVYVRAEFRAMVLNYSPREFVIGKLAAA